MSYQQEMLYNMVQGLADEGLLRDRLVGVATYLAPRIMGKFPDEPVMQGKLEKILDRLSHVPAGPGDDGKIDATVKHLSDAEARSIAHDIVDLFLEVSGGWRDSAAIGNK